MKPYKKEVAKVIIKCRKDEFIVKKTGVFPKDDRPSSASEFEACTWRPACELAGQAGQNLRKKPGLPIPFNENDLAAFFMHGWGWFAREFFGSWEDGPDDAAFDGIYHLERGEVEDAVRGAFDAYRTAERVVGPYDKTYSEKIQELENQCGPWLDAQEARERIKQAHRDADEYEAAWRKKMANQLLAGAGSTVTIVAVEELPLPQAQTATTAPVVAASDGPAPLTTFIHSSKARRNTLTPVIEMAQKQCSDQRDTAAVWGALQVLAENRTAPLIGATEDGLQYLKNGTAAILTREALRKRLGR